MVRALSNRTLEKRRRILDAARDVILMHGFRAATMESIARAAGIAKPTLYAQFADKEALFEALIEDLVTAKTEAFIAAFETEGPVTTRLSSAIAEMFGTIADLLENSPHAEELMGAHHRFAHRLESADRALSGRIANALATEGIGEPERLTKILLAGSSGILAKFSDPQDVRSAVGFLCVRLIEGSRS